MSADGECTQRRRNIAENFNRLSRVHERYGQTTDDRRQTDRRTMTYNEREREFTFAKKSVGLCIVNDIGWLIYEVVMLIVCCELHVSFYSGSVVHTNRNHSINYTKQIQMVNKSNNS